MDRVVDRVEDDTIGSRRIDLGQVLGHRLARDGETVAVQHAVVEQVLQHRRYATDSVKVAHMELAARCHVSDVRHLVGDAVEVVKFERDARLVGDREEMKHCVRGTTQRRGERDGVLEGLLGHDHSRGDTESELVDHRLAGASSVTLAAGVDGRRRCRTRHAHTERLGD